MSKNAYPHINLNRNKLTVWKQLFLFLIKNSVLMSRVQRLQKIITSKKQTIRQLSFFFSRK